MALFWKRFARHDNVDLAPPRPRFPDVFPDHPLAYTAFRENGAKLKFWIPAPVDAALERLVETTELHRAQYLRELLFTHVYGAYDMARMRELKEGLYWTPPPPAGSFSKPEPQIMFSLPEPEAPELGKSTIDVLLWMPKRMREDFNALAPARGMKPSSYARHVLIVELFGRHFLPEREALQNIDENDATQAQEGEDNLE